MNHNELTDEFRNLVMESANWGKSDKVNVEKVNESSEAEADSEDESLEEGVYRDEDGTYIYVDDQGDLYEIDESHYEEFGIETELSEESEENDETQGYFKNEDGCFYSDGEEIYQVVLDEDDQAYFVDKDHNIFEVFDEDGEIVLELSEENFELDEGSLGLQKAYRRMASAGKKEIRPMVDDPDANLQKDNEKAASKRLEKVKMKRRMRGADTGVRSDRAMPGA